MNEAAVSALNAGVDDVIGLTVLDRVYNPQADQMVDISGRIIGVVQDFPYKSVQSQIEPLVMWGTPSPVDRILYVKMTKGDYEGKINYLESKWKELIPGMPMESWFMDFEFGRLYESERRMSKIFILFASITILIAMLGLFALTSYTTERRRKEIGVRKILGASEGSLIGLLLGYFFKLVLVGFLLGVPIAYLLMNGWLESFVYRVNVSVGIIALAAALVTLITLLTVTYDTYRAAIANPIKTIRME